MAPPLGRVWDVGLEMVLSAAGRLILTALRARIGGVTVGGLAELADLPVDETREHLEALRRDGLVSASTERLLWGFGTRPAELWKLSLSERCLDALTVIPRPAPAAGPLPERVPPQFWSLFSSGTHPGDLRLPADAVTVAGRLIDSEDTAARGWALTNLPLAALQELRQMRGYDEGPAASRLDAVLAHRRDP